MTMGITSPTSTTGQILKDGTPVISFDANNNATFAGTVVSNTPLGMRNRIINGDCRIDQRNAGSAVTADGAFPLDRWKIILGGGGALSAQRSTTAPAGYTNSLYITATTADTSLGTSDEYSFRHAIEGFNVADLGWGTANAQTITLSFKVRSSVTGTYGGVLRNSAADRLYVFSYTVNLANTWEDKSVTIVGDTSGTWLTDNGIGIQLIFSLGAGSSRLASAGSWGSPSGGIQGVTGQTQWISTLNATFYITGVQLEIGTSATPFERRMYGQELINCQRYYNKSYNIETVPGTNTDVGIVSTTVNANPAGSNSWPNPIRFQVAMRSAPTISIWDKAGNASKYSSYVSPTWADNYGSITIITTGQNGCYFTQGATNGFNTNVHYTASAEL